MILLQTNCEGFWAWPWPLLLAFLLGALLGWLLKSILGGSSECANCKSLEADLALSKKNANKACPNCKGLQADLDACRGSLKTAETGLVKATAATAFTVAKVDDSVKDDLTKVEGIGPKIKELLYADGIWSFEQLSKAETSRIQKVLDDAGPRFRIHNPKTWAEQSGIAARGEWDALLKWQDELKGGL